MPLICCVSPKGGVGKTMVTANLAVGLAKKRRFQVIAVDFDPQNMLRLHLGGNLADGHGFVEAFEKSGNWGDALRQDRQSGVVTLPYGHLSTNKALAADSLLAQRPDLLWKPLLRMAAAPDMVVIIDTPPGPSVMTQAILPYTDLLLTVLAADTASVVLYADIASGKTYSEVKSEQRRFIINQFDPMTRLGKAIGQGLADKMGQSLLGKVHRDEHVGEALAMQQSVTGYAPQSRAASDLNLICERVSRYLENLP